MFISDTHSAHLKIPQNWFYESDIAVCGGDFTNIGGYDDCISFQKWFSELPCRYHVLIAGNHDLSFDIENKGKIREFSSKNPKDNDWNLCKSVITECKKLIYLEENSVEIEGLKIWGSPYSPFFCNWGFPTTEDDREYRWSKIPKDHHIIITHGPPIGILDTLYNGNTSGCSELYKRIFETKPLVHIFGHIHEAYGILKKDNIIFLNASILNFHYKVQNLPIYIDFIKK